MKAKIKQFLQELDIIIKRDPATTSRIEAFLCSPGYHSILFYRFSHRLWQKNFKLFARILSQIARFFTGVEIHPGAKIGHNFFIDHGMGVVIGQTAVIGENVTMYHGVTLGGTKSYDNQDDTKRHPTIGDNCVIGSYAQILGPINIGENSLIGSNATVVKDVKPNTTVIGMPAHRVSTKPHDEFSAYGIDVDLMDLYEKRIRRLEKELIAIKSEQK